MNEVTFPADISYKDFISEVNRAKRLVDHGVRDYFILADTKSFKDNSQIGNTTLKDIEDVFGKGYIEFFRFGVTAYGEKDPDAMENFMTYSLRHITKQDKKKLRNTIRFFPENTWVVDWRSADKHQMLVPFVQKEDGSILYLADDPVYRVCGRVSGKVEDLPNAWYWKKAIEDMPDYFDALFAVINYKHTDIVIPLPKKCAKKTFAKREKDAFGVKRRLVHEVKAHERHMAKSATPISEHLRGTSEITIDGIDVSLITSVEWSKKYLKKALSKEAIA